MILKLLMKLNEKGRANFRPRHRDATEPEGYRNYATSTFTRIVF